MNIVTTITQGNVCRVKYLPRLIGKKLDGEVVCGPCSARFTFNTSRDVVVDGGEISFGPGKASFLRIGDEIIADVEEVNGRYVVVAWTHQKDYVLALEFVELTKRPKPAPAIPVVTAEASKMFIPSKLVNQTNGRDRRTALLLPFERNLARAAKEMEMEMGRNGSSSAVAG